MQSIAHEKQGAIAMKTRATRISVAVSVCPRSPEQRRDEGKTGRRPRDSDTSPGRRGGQQCHVPDFLARQIIDGLHAGTARQCQIGLVQDCVPTVKDFDNVKQRRNIM